MNSPKSLNELYAFLAVRPRIRVTGFKGDVADATFTYATIGGMFYVEDLDARRNVERFLPLACKLTDNAERNESGVVFDDAGFTLTKFGLTIRVDYLPEEDA